MKQLLEDIRSTLHIARWHWRIVRAQRGKNWCDECQKQWCTKCPYDFAKKNFHHTIRACQEFEAKCEK